MKKFFLVILTLALSLSFAVTALAAAPITIEPMPEDASFALQELSVLWPNNAYPDDVGGIVYNNAQGKAIVLLTNNTAARQAEIRRLIKHHTALQFFSCKYSFKQLKAVQDDIAARYGFGDKSGIAGIGIGWSGGSAGSPGFGVSGFEHRVVVHIVTTQAYNRLQRELLARYGDIVYAELTSGYSIPQTDEGASDTDAVPMQAAQYQTMRVASGEVNVRTGPDVELYPVKCVLKRGEVVEVVGERGKWLEIRRGSASGYAYADYLKPEGETLRFATERVNVRKGASASSELLGVLEAGEAVSYVKRANGWAKVSYKGQTGYVYAKYLTASRSNCFFKHPLAELIGKKNIKSVYYSYAPVWLPNIQDAGTPRLSVTYNIRMSEGAASVTVYGFASASEALLARKAIETQVDFADVSQFYYQNGSEIIVLSTQPADGAAYTQDQAKLVERIAHAIADLYGKELAR